MNQMSMTKKVLVASAIITTAAGTAAVPQPAATAAPSSAAAAVALTAMDACKAGEAPDATQTVFLSGTNGRASYPRGVRPDNAIFPGDVVTVEVTGQLRYNATQWTGPEGTGTPDANGIRPYAATATWNNLPDGRVGSPMAAVGLSLCTDAPKTPVRLLYGIKDKDLSNNGGGFTITTRVWKAPGRLTIDRTEVTQGVQNRSGQVALIARKRTFVRVFFHHKNDGSAAMSGVTGTLEVPGVDGAIRPLVNRYVTSRTGGGDDRTLDNNLLFEVPRAALAEGSRQLVVTVTPPADRGGGWPIVRHVPVELGPMTRLDVIGLRYGYSNVPQALTDQRRSSQPGLGVQAGRWLPRPLSAWEPMRMMAENALPYARLAVSDDAIGDIDGTRFFDCRAGQRPDGLRYCDGWTDAIAWAKRFADRECPEGGCLIVLLQPEVTDGGDGYCHCVSYRQGTPKDNSVINLQGERLLANQGITLAHEIGHYLSLLHTWEDPHFGDRNDNALIGDMIGLRYAPIIRLEPQHRPEGGSTYDLMTYQTPAWFSVYHYCKAMHYLAGRHPTCYRGWDQ